ncbi:ATP-binding protein [Blautia obeum]|uniref:ATP-binding protein n=1 Tax=Blautia obeum TaxID=40520 RepID=UPI003D057F04
MLKSIYFLLLILQEITSGIFIHLLLTPKNSQRFCLLVWSVTALWMPVGRSIQMAYESMKPVIFISGVLLWMVLALLLYRDPIWKRVTAVLLTLCVNIFLDSSLMLLFYLVNPALLDQAAGCNVYAVVMNITAEAVLVLVYMCTLQLWNLIRDRRLIKGYLPTLLLPVSQACFALRFNVGIGGHSNSYSMVFFLGAILGLCLDIYWMYDLLYRSRQTEVEQELKEMHHVMELEHVHYQEIESKREEVAKIRHDINNQILAARHLISEGDTERSEHMLEQLLEQVSATKEYPYCAVPIINAILNEKNRLCEQHQIELVTDLSFPSDLHVDDVMLCSLFSNLLDNAIHAVEDMDPGKRWIRISAITEGGFLVVKTRNPSGKPEPVKRGHGKGTVILQEIAEMYGGMYQTEYWDGIFTAVVNIELNQEH